MPRPARIVVPGVPLHITQRGVDRDPTFLADEDYAFYRWALADASAAFACAVHAYVLMTNHVHLLVSPTDPAGPRGMMQSLGRRYVRYFNDRYHRTGTLWEGRFRSALVPSAAYLFTCSRYIELNPVHAGMVADPATYEWSSFHANALGLSDPIVAPHPEYVALGAHRGVRCEAYRSLFGMPLESDVVAALRATQRARPPLHASRYRQLVEALRDQREDAPRDGTLLPMRTPRATAPGQGA